MGFSLRKLFPKLAAKPLSHSDEQQDVEIEGARVKRAGVFTRYADNIYQSNSYRMHGFQKIAELKKADVLQSIPLIVYTDTLDPRIFDLPPMDREMYGYPRTFEELVRKHDEVIIIYDGVIGDHDMRFNDVVKVAERMPNARILELPNDLKNITDQHLPSFLVMFGDCYFYQKDKSESTRVMASLNSDREAERANFRNCLSLVTLMSAERGKSPQLEMDFILPAYE